MQRSSTSCSCRKVLQSSVGTDSREDGVTSGAHLCALCTLKISVRFTISINENKTLPLATVAEFITDQNVKSVLVEELVESLNSVTVHHPDRPISS